MPGSPVLSFWIFPIYAPSTSRANRVWPVLVGPGSTLYLVRDIETHQRRSLLASSTRSATRTISMILSAYPIEFRAPTRIQRRIVSVVYPARTHRVRLL